MTSISAIVKLQEIRELKKFEMDKIWSKHISVAKRESDSSEYRLQIEALELAIDALRLQNVK